MLVDYVIVRTGQDLMTTDTKQQQGQPALIHLETKNTVVNDGKVVCKQG